MRSPKSRSESTRRVLLTVPLFPISSLLLFAGKTTRLSTGRKPVARVFLKAIILGGRTCPGQCAVARIFGRMNEIPDSPRLAHPPWLLFPIPMWCGIAIVLYLFRKNSSVLSRICPDVPPRRSGLHGFPISEAGSNSVPDLPRISGFVNRIIFREIYYNLRTDH